MKPSCALAAFTALCALCAPGIAGAAIEVDGRNLEVVDMHLHPGHFGQMPAGAIEFLTQAAPGPARLFSPVLFESLLDPYAEHIGILAQTRMAGVDHAVLLAVYTHHTSGYLSNEQLEALLSDPRNVSSDGPLGRAPWAWGMVSVNFFDGYVDAGLAEARLRVVETYLEQRRDLFIGIKLAHAHQAVTFDDSRYVGIYDVAGKYAVPVLLHTGFSPFPNSQTEPAYYDPQGLESIIAGYDGAHGQPRVNFVLSHVGQGDARSVEHAIGLAQRYDNVYLELSALKRPLLIDESGQPISETEPQYPFVLAEIKKRGLVHRTLWASDGPQFSGMVRSYLETMVEGMQSAGFTVDEIASVLSGNFYSLYFPSATPS